MSGLALEVLLQHEPVWTGSLCQALALQLRWGFFLFPSLFSLLFLFASLCLPLLCEGDSSASRIILVT